MKLDQPVRNNWTDWRMIKDNKRRKLLVQHAPDRLRMQAIKKNDILPAEIIVIIIYLHSILALSYIPISSKRTSQLIYLLTIPYLIYDNRLIFKAFNGPTNLFGSSLSIHVLILIQK